jgi:hypothetical protein
MRGALARLSQWNQLCTTPLVLFARHALSGTGGRALY